MSPADVRLECLRLAITHHSIMGSGKSVLAVAEEFHVWCRPLEADRCPTCGQLLPELATTVKATAADLARLADKYGPR